MFQNYFHYYYYLSESRALSKHGGHPSSKEKERQVLQICVLFCRVLLKPLTDSSVCAMANVHLAAATSLLLHLKNNTVGSFAAKQSASHFHSPNTRLQSSFRFSFPWPQHLVTKLPLVSLFHGRNTWLQSCLSFLFFMAATLGYKAASRFSFPWPQHLVTKLPLFFIIATLGYKAASVSIAATLGYKVAAANATPPVASRLQVCLFSFFFFSCKYLLPQKRDQFCRWINFVGLT